MLLKHFFGRKLRNAGLAAQQIEPLAGLLQNAQKSLGKFHARDLLLQRRAEDPRAEDDARAVRQDERRAVEQAAERLVVQRLIGDLSVRRHAIDRLRAVEQLAAALKCLLHGQVIILYAQNICFQRRSLPLSIVIDILSQNRQFVYDSFFTKSADVHTML